MRMKIVCCLLCLVNNKNRFLYHFTFALVNSFNTKHSHWQYLHDDDDFKKDWMRFYTRTVDWFGTEREQITAAVSISNDCCTFSLEQLMMTMHSDLLSNCQSYLCF